MWEILRGYEFPPPPPPPILKKKVGVQFMFTRYECCVQMDGTLSDWFEVKTGVRQDVLSPFLFLFVMDWVMRKASANGNGISWAQYKEKTVGSYL